VVGLAVGLRVEVVVGRAVDVLVILRRILLGFVVASGVTSSVVDTVFASFSTWTAFSCCLRSCSFSCSVNRLLFSCSTFSSSSCC